MDRLRKIQALSLAIEAVEWDLDRHRHSFSEQMSMVAHLKKLRAMRAALAEEFDEALNERIESPVD